MFEMNTLQSDLNEMVSVCCLRRERIQVLTFSLDENIYTSKVSNRKGFFHLNPRIQNKKEIISEGKKKDRIEVENTIQPFHIKIEVLSSIIKQPRAELKVGQQ